MDKENVYPGGRIWLPRGDEQKELTVPPDHATKAKKGEKAT